MKDFRHMMYFFYKKNFKTTSKQFLDKIYQKSTPVCQNLSYYVVFKRISIFFMK